MVVECVDERHIRRAAWLFPAYLLLINVFVLPIAIGGLLIFGPGQANPETFVLSLPLGQGAPALALFAYIGGLSALTGMLIVETVAVSTMVCNDLVMPTLLRLGRFGARAGGDLTRLLLNIRRTAIVAVLMLGYLYFRVAGEAYALVSIGLISFAAVAQFAPALLGGIYWRGGTGAGALGGLLGGFAIWAYTLMLPSVAKSGWIAVGLPRARPARDRAARARTAVRPCRPRQPHPLAVLEPVDQPRALRRPLARPQPLGPRGEPGAALRRRLPPRRRRAGVLARPRPARRPAHARRPLPRPRPRQRALRRARPRDRRPGPRPRRRRPPRRPGGAPGRRRRRHRLGARHGRIGRPGGAALGRRRARDPRRGLAAPRLRPRARGEVALARAGDRRAPRRQRAAAEPRPPEGRLHVLGHPRAPHAADLDPRPLRADARQPGHGAPSSARSSSGSSSPRASA